MKPTSSNIPQSGGCTPVSALCVQLAGICIPGIEQCPSDKLHEVLIKMGDTIKDIKSSINLSDLDLKCLFTACATCPNPDKTLKSVLALLIQKHCDLKAAVDAIGTGGTTGEEKVVKMASCFHFKNTDQETVDQLSVSEYVKRIGTRVCENSTQIDNLTDQVSTIDGRVDIIEGKLSAASTLPLISTACIDGVPKELALDVVVDKMEEQFCQLKGVLGKTADLTTAVGKQTAEGMGDSKQIDALSNRGTAIGGWNYNPSTIADAVSNIWLSITDMRGAVKTIQDNCCKITCSDITIDFDIKLNNDRTVATLFFAAKSIFPVGFSDVNTLGNKVTITDSAGHIHYAYVKIADETQNPDGIEIDLSNSALDPKLSYTFDIDAAVTNGSMTCVKCINKVVTFKNLDACEFCQISVTGGASVTGSLVVVYTV